MSSLQGYFPLTLAQDAANPPPPPPASAPQTAAPTGATQTSTAAPANGQTVPPKPQGGIDPWMLALGFIAIVYFMFILPQKREKRKAADLMAAMKKGDKAQTAGGILGTIVEIRDTEIVLKVDDASNTRIRFVKTAIVSVTSAEAPKA